MSLGKSKQSSTQQSTQQATSTQSLDPTIMSWLGENLQRAKGIADTPYQPYTGQRVADFTPDQLQAFGLLGDIASNQTGAQTLQSGINAAQGVAGYQPQQVTGATSGATGATAAEAAAASINRGDVRDVVPQSLLGLDLSGYLNPYTDSVVNTTVADMDRQLQQEQARNMARATAAKAFGGSRDALVAAETNRDFNSSIADTIAQLRSAGYVNAQNQAQTDLNRRLQADLANQGVDLNVAGANAGFTQAANLANAGAQTATSQFNAGQANQIEAANADRAQQAALANQAAARDAATLNLQGAGLLGDLSNTELTQAATRAGLLGQAGDMQQQRVQQILDAAYQQYGEAQNWPIQLQMLLNASLGLAGNPTLTDSQSSGQSTGSSKGSGWNIGLSTGGGSGGASFASMFGGG